MTRSTRMLAIGTALATAALVAACGGGEAPTPAGVTLDAAEFSFTPSTITAAADEAFTVTLVNKGTVEHDFTIDANQTKIAVAVGKTASGEVAGLPAGTYEFYCSVAGHKEGGMLGTLTVQ